MHVEKLNFQYLHCDCYLYKFLYVIKQPKNEFGIPDNKGLLSNVPINVMNFKWKYIKIIIKSGNLNLAIQELDILRVS